VGLTNFTRIFYTEGKDKKWNFEYIKVTYELGLQISFIKENLDSRFLTFKNRRRESK